MKWIDETEFEGQWKSDSRIQGTLKMVDGKIYVGHFKNDVFHG